MKNSVNLQNVINWILSFCKNSTLHKVLLIVILVCSLLFVLYGCSSHRQFNVTVDKADSVKINYTDSLSAVYPQF